jgi:arylsulfatase A-like enzyme
MSRLMRLALALVMLLPIGAAAAPKPNIVFILIDDLGQRDLGCYGSTFYETPNVDALAVAGMRFTDAYAACCVCSPTRASILTGKYPARLGITDWLPGRKDAPEQKLRRPALLGHLPAGEVTIAQALKQGGYATGLFGKWHLGGPEFYPEKHGFNVNVGGCDLGHPPSYFSPYKIPNLPDGPKGEYLTDRLTSEACKFIESNKDRPFFLYLSHYAVHNPQQAKPDVIARFKAKAAALPKPSAEHPEFIAEGANRARQVQNQPVYAANVAAMDDSVGQIIAKLKALDLDRNTIVVFTSDNGGLSTSEGLPTSNLPLRAGKGWNYEGGLRVPLIVRWPAAVKPNTTCATPTISTDYCPTFLEAAGLPLNPAQHVDGVSVLPLFKGGAIAARPLFWHYPHYSNQGGRPSAAVRLGDFKLVESFEDDRSELYNLKDDLGERHDLAAMLPEKRDELAARLRKWRTDVGALMPTPNPDYRPKK